jgi:hypothetical protein
MSNDKEKIIINNTREVTISGVIKPIFTKYYTLMGRNKNQNEWYHISTHNDKKFVENEATRFTYDYYNLIEFELETYEDEELYSVYHRQQKFKRIIKE